MRIFFVDSSQPAIHRGWNPEFVAQDLAKQNIETFTRTNRSAKEIHQSSWSKDDVVWPCCYTCGPSTDDPLVIEACAEYGIRHVGPSRSTYRLNSKLQLAHALSSNDFHVPRTVVLDNYRGGFSFPCLLKTEFSSNSDGVRIVHAESELKRIKGVLQGYGQRLILQEWVRHEECTVAVLPAANNEILIAPLGVEVRNGRYIDARAKRHNDQLRFYALPPDSRREVQELVRRMIVTLNLKGHFRVDVLRDEHGILYPIDVNCQPDMNSNVEEISYFPLALSVNYDLQFADVIHHILTYSTYSDSV